MFLLVPAHPCCPGQIPQSRKTVVVCVCVCNALSAPPLNKFVGCSLDSFIAYTCCDYLWQNDRFWATYVASKNINDLK